MKFITVFLSASLLVACSAEPTKEEIDFALSEIEIAEICGSEKGNYKRAASKLPFTWRKIEVEFNNNECAINYKLHSFPSESKAKKKFFLFKTMCDALDQASKTYTYPDNKTVIYSNPSGSGIIYMTIKETTLFTLAVRATENKRDEFIKIIEMKFNELQN